MKKLLALILLPLALLAQVPQNVQKLSGALTQGFTVPSSTTISATGTGVIHATSVNSGTASSLTALSIRSTGAAFDLTFASSEVLTAGRTLTWNVADAARSVTLGGNLSLAGSLTTSGAYASTFTMTGTTTVTFPTSGTLATTAGTVASIAGTTNEISASASTGAVTLSLAGPHNFTTLTSTALLLGAGTSAITAADLTYVSPTLSVPDAFSISSAGSIALTAGGAAKSITLTPSTTGIVSVVGSGVRLDGTARSLVAWGVTGPGYSALARTITDSSSSGTVATAVANSFGVPTFAASSATTFTQAANVYIAGDAAAGTNVTNTNSVGLWNAGKSRFDGSSTFNSSVLLASGARFSINTDAESVGDLGNTGYMMQLRSKSITNTSSSGTVAINTAFSLGIPTLLANSATTYTDATVWYSDGAPVASTNVTITRKHSVLIQDGTGSTDAITGAVVISSTIASTTNSTGIGGGNINTSGTISTGSATYMHVTSVALTDGAGASVGTITNAPAAGNPTKWIQINDNGTTRKIPAW